MLDWLNRLETVEPQLPFQLFDLEIAEAQFNLSFFHLYHQDFEVVASLAQLVLLAGNSLLGFQLFVQ